MLNKKTTLSIGIPAYNEEANIKNLLLQIDSTFDASLLDKIIVISDGSSDRTSKKVMEVNNNRILLIDDPTRLGKSTRLNQLIELCESDYLLLLDSDIVLGKNTISILLNHAISENLDCACPILLPINSDNLFKKCLNESRNVTQFIKKNLNNGDNVYSCHGAAILLSKHAYKQITIPKTVGNDAYIYFSIKKIGLNFGLVDTSKVYYRLPNSFADHYKQSTRFNNSINKMREYFGKDIKNAYSVPIKIYFSMIFQLNLISALYLFGYILIQTTVMINKWIHPIKLSDDLWVISNSTK